jgi:HK97 gp10 family phage protein
MDVKTHVTGVPELKELLSALPSKLRKQALRNALAAGARLVRDEARANTPVLSAEAARKAPYRKPGTVRNALAVRTSKIARRAGDVGVFVNVRPAKVGARGAKSRDDPFYWRWLEFGWTPATGPRGRGAGRGAAVRARRMARRGGGAPAIAGRGFLRAGAQRLQQALQVFTQKIGPQIERLAKKNETR